MAWRSSSGGLPPAASPACDGISCNGSMSKTELYDEPRGGAHSDQIHLRDDGRRFLLQNFRRLGNLAYQFLLVNRDAPSLANNSIGFSRRKSPIQHSRRRASLSLSIQQPSLFPEEMDQVPIHGRTRGIQAGLAPGVQTERQVGVFAIGMEILD
jgi:hypothetical protein